MSEKKTVRPNRGPSFTGLRAKDESSSRSKRANKKRDTKPELLLRRTLWRLGLRYFVDVSDLPGRPDIVFSRAKVAVFCDGDFWHGRNWDERRSKLEAGWNADYWVAKITRNIERDRQVDLSLREMGWEVIRVWESDILRDIDEVAQRIQKSVMLHRKGVRSERTSNGDRE